MKGNNDSNTDEIRVCALVPYPPDTTPSQRYRIEQWMPLLKAQGISVDLIPFADEGLMRHLHKPGRHALKAAAGVSRFLHRFADVAAVSRYDVVLVHRAVSIGGPALLERLIKLSGRPMIFDFDDAIFLLHTTEANRRFGWMKFPGKTATICRLSSHVVVGNGFLAEYAQHYNSQVTVIPTSIDTDNYQPVKKNGSKGRLILGWTGSSTSQTHLEMFAPLLRKLIAQLDIELRVISNREPELPQIPFTWRPWSVETEVEEIAQFDIGIMPIPDDIWARGKCALKALQYMALGIPAVCSAVGANCEVITDNENGLLARTPEDWIEKLELLASNPSFRADIGAAGRKTVNERYSARHCAELFAHVVREVVNRRTEVAKNA
jgi:glycosyltransferase involved in cell wall biosynthesis